MHNLHCLLFKLQSSRKDLLSLFVVSLKKINISVTVMTQSDLGYKFDLPNLSEFISNINSSDTSVLWKRGSGLNWICYCLVVFLLIIIICLTLLLLTLVNQSRQTLLVDPDKIRVLSVTSLFFYYTNVTILLCRCVQAKKNKVLVVFHLASFRIYVLQSRSIQKTNSISLYWTIIGF